MKQSNVPLVFDVGRVYKDRCIALIRALIHEIFLQKKRSIEEIIHSTIPFNEKLHLLISEKSDTSVRQSKEFIQEMLRHPGWVEQPTDEIKGLMLDLFNEGKATGYIDKDLPNHVLLLYIEIFKAGTDRHAEELAKLNNPELEQIITMFFSGMTPS